MTVSYRGSLSLGGVMPLALTAQAQLGSTVGATMPDVQARVTGLLALSVQPPPSLAAMIASVNALLASLQTLLTVPTIDASATLAALAELQATLGQLNASLAFSVSFGSLLGVAGIHFYAYAGEADALAPELSGFLSAGLPGGGGPNEHIAGVMLLANDGAAIEALEAMFP